MSQAGGTASGCSDIRDMNDAKVANILAYLDGAMQTVKTIGSDHTGLSGSCTGAPLTSSALQHISDSLPSSLTAPLSATPSVANASSLAYAQQATAETAQQTYIGIKRKIEALHFENAELQRQNDELLQRMDHYRALDHQRREEMRASVQNDVADLRKEVASSKKKLNERTQRWSEEKEAFLEQIESLKSELRQEVLRHDEERRKLELANTTAIRTLKAKWQAQENAAREKWKLAEARRIKETTLQSLEPDIVLLLNRHKAEKARMREEFENELRHRDEQIAAKDASVDAVKAQLHRDAEATLQREQQAFQDRLREETSRVHRHLEDERRAAESKQAEMEAFYAEQKRTFQREIERLGGEVLQLRRTQTTEQASFHEAVSNEVARITAQSNAQIEALKQKLAQECGARERDAEAQNAKYLQSKEAELRRRCELDRDAAIAKVVQKLEEEHVRAITSSRGNDGLLRERCSQLTRDNERLGVELELVRGQLQSALATKQQQEEAMQKLREAADLSQERVRAIEARVESQFNNQLSVLDNTWQQKLIEAESEHAKREQVLRADVEEQHRLRENLEHEQSMAARTLEQKHHAELNQINERMLVAMTVKENTIHALNEKVLALEEAVRVRDQELERHRTLLS